MAVRNVKLKAAPHGQNMTETLATGAATVGMGKEEKERVTFPLLLYTWI